MATLKISELQPGHIYRETLSGMRVRFQYAFGDGRGSAIYFSQPMGRFIAFDIRDGELMEEPANGLRLADGPASPTQEQRDEQRIER